MSLLAIGLLLAGCEVLNPTADVRFQNLMSDRFSFPYGLRLGEATYEEPLLYGQSSPYYSTSPGKHSVQAKSNNGSWITISNGSMTVEANMVYTLVISGTHENSTFQLIED